MTQSFMPKSVHNSKVRCFFQFAIDSQAYKPMHIPSRPYYRRIDAIINPFFSKDDPLSFHPFTIFTSISICFGKYKYMLPLEDASQHARECLTHICFGKYEYMLPLKA